ncbi:mitotic fidelity of chromosome transmission-related protein [Cryptotrichosporon argae]
MPATPGRRTGARYLPHNALAGTVGTITGRAMPAKLPRDSGGFEDADEFFKSPETVVGGRKGKTPAKTPGKPSESPKGPGKTPRGRGPLVTPARSRGRLSQLADDEDEEQYADDLLVDENDVDPPSVSIPRKSALPPASPSVDYDHLPSPSGRRGGPRTTASAAIPRASRASRVPADITTDGFVDDEAGADGLEDDENEDEDDGHDAPAQSGNKFKSRRMTTVSAISAEGGRDADDMRLSLAAPVDAYDNADGFENDMGDNGADYAEDSFGELGNGAADEDLDGNRTLDPIHEEEEDEAPVIRKKKAPVVEQEEDEEEERPVSRTKKDGRVQEEEDEDEDEAPTRKKTKTAAKVAKKAPARREPAARVERSGSQIRRSRASGIAVEDHQYDGDFTCRRSGRRHFAPLAWWRNEKFEYARGDAVPEIVEVVHVAPEPARPLGGSGKRARAAQRTVARGRSGSRARSESYHPQEEGWDAKTNPIGLVKEWPSGVEINRRIALPKSLLKPKQVLGSEFLYQKVFGEDIFVASGMVHIPVNGSKPGKPSKDNTYMFYVAKGAVQVIIHKTSFVMAVGGQFMVPRGNHYSIENISPTTTAELFFAQARKIRAHEEDEAVPQGRPSIAPSEAPSEAA